MKSLMNFKTNFICGSGKKFKFVHKSDFLTSHKSDHIKIHTGQAIYSVPPPPPPRPLNMESMQGNIVLGLFYFDSSDLPVDEEIRTTSPCNLKNFDFDQFDLPIEYQICMRGHMDFE